MSDIGIVRGLIELQDDFTGKLGLAEAALNNFTKKNQESLMAVGQAVGIVTAAFALAATAVYNLGQHGADVVDVEQTLEHFSGTAAAAAANLEGLRQGTQGTVDDFTLMKEASALLSANVKLNADDFGALGEAAFVLQNRGLGSTKEMLDLVSDALVTGKTKALATKLGVIDLGDAEQKYAEQLGVTAAQLSDAGKAEAHRVQVMGMLNAAVKDAGTQERDFGEKIEYAKAQLTNFIDEIAKAIATSPALAAGLDAVERAIKAAFGGDNTSLIKTVMEGIKEGAVIIVDFGIAAIEAARVFHTAWSGVKALILGVEAAVAFLAEGVADAVALVLNVAAALPGAGDALKETARAAKETADYMRAVTNSFADQAAEAAKGITQTSEFDKTLDTLSGTLFNVRDAVKNADAMQQKSNETTDIAANNAKKLAAVQHDVSQAMVDRAKIEDELWKIEEKSIKETTQVWNEYFRTISQNSDTSLDAQRRSIQAWFDDEVSKLDDSDRNWQEHYNALEALAKAKLEQIGMDWGSVRDKSIEALQEQAEVARATYDAMIYGTLHFTRDALEEQLQKVHDAEDAARGLGKAMVDGQKAAAAAVNETTIKIRTLSGEMITLEEAQKRQSAGGSTEINKGNLGAFASWWKIPNDVAFRLAALGFSFQEIVDAYRGGFAGDQFKGPDWKPHGPRIPGFKDGGIVMVGEGGPEMVRLPHGSQVYPTGTPLGSGGGATLTNHIYVNGTATDVARKIMDEIMRQMKLHRQFPSA